MTMDTTMTAIPRDNMVRRYCVRGAASSAKGQLLPAGRLGRSRPQSPGIPAPSFGTVEDSCLGAAPRCYPPLAMPTKRPRLTLTETPVVARRLELAATRFPERATSRADLLLALTEVAEEALANTEGEDNGRGAAKRRVLACTRDITPAAAQAMIAAREDDWPDELGP